jgi:hypothetical protein
MWLPGRSEGGALGLPLKSHEEDDMTTLVDCGCVARVHGDGSGVEIDFCELHDAAPVMQKALRKCRDALKAAGRTDGEAYEMAVSLVGES